MNEHPNAERVRALFRAFHERDLETVQASLAADAVWHFPGTHGQLAGSHRGHEAIFTFLLSVAELTDDTFSLDLIDVLANDDRAVALFRGHGRRGERELDNPTTLVIRMEAGQAKEIHEFVWNLFDVDKFWT
ncbi:MAG: ketosteroid isomerase-like protein [Hyphomicrobiaceae bacterium]|jgi:ketosteroid isomerase-like protein